MFSKMIDIREKRPNTEPKSCKASATLKRNFERSKLKTKRSDRGKPFFIAKKIIITKAREGKKLFEASNRGGKSQEKKARKRKPLL